MKITKKNLALTCALLFLANANTAIADWRRMLMQFLIGEKKTYPQLLTNPQTTQTLGPWFYRYYPANGHLCWG